MAAEGWKGRALASLEAQWTSPVLPLCSIPLRARIPRNSGSGQTWTSIEDQSLVKWLEQALAPAKNRERLTLAAWSSKEPRLHRRSLSELVGRIEHLVQAGHANALDTSKVVKLLLDLRGMYPKVPPVVVASRPLEQVRVSASSTMSLMDRVVSKTKAAIVVKVDGRLAHGPLPAPRRLPPLVKAAPSAALAPPPRPPSPAPRPPPPPPPAPVKAPRIGRPLAEAYFPSRVLPPPARTTRWFNRPPIVDLPRYTHWVPPALNVGRSSLMARLRTYPPLLLRPPPAPPSAPALSRSSSTTASSTGPPHVALVKRIRRGPSAEGPRSMAHLLEPALAAAPPPQAQQPQPQRPPMSSVKSAGKRLWDMHDSNNSMTVFERRTRMRVGARGGTWRQGEA
ncbi:uncharacterized protein RHOBADRAFT_43498 [Rhodotorula graminis WP1]|uniref:Uncharacterized protein n=1 Tax=Rhodotorula graminis (strain WP1) TaxID=578459 RepID=A0A194S688_RHOGW|nr:uncharacterized protein RHOBADRAFT_43498 [Rhodotorula graminis WP1]KPV76059.1 hypothetical protein RHOBADRAFT_43498 [Rhodotorula graminis WP1]